MAECAVLLGVSAAVDEEKKTWLESLKQSGSRQNSAEKQSVSAERDDNRRPLRLEIDPTDTAFSTGGEHRNLIMGRTELSERGSGGESSRAVREAHDHKLWPAASAKETTTSRCGKVRRTTVWWWCLFVADSGSHVHFHTRSGKAGQMLLFCNN